MALLNIFLGLLNIVQIILIAYLLFGTIYIFVFSTAALFRLKRKSPKKEFSHSFAVLIPGYKEDAVIIEAAREASDQNYPDDFFDVIIIADSFQPETISELKKIAVKVVEVSFDISTKSKALNKALDQFSEDAYDVALVLDADNIMEKNFLMKLNDAFNAGCFAVQGHRIAKNTNTHFALLDAISEEINNNIFRKGHRILGLSSSLIGSGMAFRFSYFKELMKNIKAIGGFDKEIELTMLRNGKKIEYLENALILDEKVQVSEVFVKQRRRWLSAQLHYSKYLPDAIYNLLKKGNIDFFDKSIQMVLPPRIILLGIIPLFTIISLFVNPLPITLIWVVVFLLLILSMLFAIPWKFYSFTTLSALTSLPKGFFL
ncbi:MAG: glycosyltransferase, partial [Bacteroidota bacterium]